MKIKDLIAELENTLHEKGNVEVIIDHFDEHDYCSNYFRVIDLSEPTINELNIMIWKNVATTTEPSDYLIIR